MVFFIQWPKWDTWKTLVSTVMRIPTKASSARAGTPQTTPFTASFTFATPSRKLPPASSAAAAPAVISIAAVIPGIHLIFRFIVLPCLSVQLTKKRPGTEKPEDAFVSCGKVYNAHFLTVNSSGD